MSKRLIIRKNDNIKDLVSNSGIWVEEVLYESKDDPRGHLLNSGIWVESVLPENNDDPRDDLAKVERALKTYSSKISMVLEMSYQTVGFE